jgi:hypothetical protein
MRFLRQGDSIKKGFKMKKLSDIKVGDKVKNVKNLSYEGISILPGDYTIGALLKDGKGNTISHYGIVSEMAFMDWGDLNGICPPGHGIWLSATFFIKNFAYSEFGKKLKIGGEFIFKRRNLEGKNCMLISKLPNSKVAFVEFDENIDGCGADGLGKAGRCALVPYKILEKVK